MKQKGMMKERGFLFVYCRKKQGNGGRSKGKHKKTGELKETKAINKDEGSTLGKI